MAVTSALINFGLSYYRYVRQDAMGMGVVVVCVVIAFLIGWPLIRRRRELQKQS